MSTQADFPYSVSENVINSFFNGTLNAGVVCLGDEGLELRDKCDLMGLLKRIAELEEKVRLLERGNYHES